MDWTNFVDVYSCMLFEATADSEADSDVNKSMDHALLSEDIGFAEDDAMSSSCDDCDFQDFGHYSTDHHEFDLDDEENKEEELAADYRNGDDDDDDEEEEDGAVDQLPTGDRKVKDLKPTGAAASRGVLMKGHQSKRLKVCADSIMQFRNERDNDRHFWETCLAS